MKTTTVEERLTRIELEFDELKHAVLGLKPRTNSWRQQNIAMTFDEIDRALDQYH